ncbi:hypothetical protein PYW07_011265 [Mythimna separata]|uniref:Fatty acyl-CoA reductase n=1 Tax=Mythimna separata TaxID=271217 RepID=A0AAD7Y9D2_MYTSE|nr:hypothetical protein PYW07_011265 [Mythimna separata]
MVETEPMDPAQEFEAKLLLRHKPMNEATERGDSSVQQFYRDAAVLVTGGSGFLGKQLVEKLFSAVLLTGGSGFLGKQLVEKLFRATQVSKVFFLLRPKKGKPIKQRLDEILQDPVYDLVKERNPKFAERIIPVAGDVAALRLGLSDKDWNMITEEVNIIYHMAATTRFDECLRVATLINVRGAREALILGKACKKLKAYVHVSTAYSHACVNLINTEVLEDFYSSPVDPETLIRLAETADEERLNDITPGLIKNWPNTYSFAKAVAEETVRSMCDDLPLCIVRPAIVICAAREPNPGWLDMSNVYGASGIILGPGLGLMHTILANKDVRIGLVPVDYVNNAIIAAAYETARKATAGPKTPKIYTLCTRRNPAYWWQHTETVETIVKPNYPTPAAVGPSFAWQTKNATLFWIYSWLLQLIPGYIVDGVCLVLGKERRFAKLYTKMYKMSTALSYFTVNDWNFVDENTANLYNSLSSIDKEIFDFDVTKIDWQEHLATDFG